MVCIPTSICRLLLSTGATVLHKYRGTAEQLLVDHRVHVIYFIGNDFGYDAVITSLLTILGRSFSWGLR
jgi:hypothetical protein